MGRKLRTNISKDCWDDEQLMKTWGEAVEVAAWLADLWQKGFIACVALTLYLISIDVFIFASFSAAAAFYCYMLWSKHTMDESNANYLLHNLEVAIQREKGSYHRGPYP